MLDASYDVICLHLETTPTHWKQTVLWLKEEDDYVLQPGESIDGELTYCKDELNPRSICIDLKLIFPDRFENKKELTRVYLLD